MEKKRYQAPTLKVVEFKVERGFQASGGSFSLNIADNQFELLETDNGFRNEGFGRETYDESSFWGN